MLFRGWYIVGAAFLTLLVTVGVPFYGLPFFYDYFIRDFGWSRAETTGGIALATILIQPLTGFVVDRFSPRLLIGVGAGFCSLSRRLQLGKRPPDFLLSVVVPVYGRIHV